MSTHREKIDGIRHAISVVEERVERYLYYKNTRGILESTEQYDLEKCLKFIEMGNNLLEDMGEPNPAPERE